MKDKNKWSAWTLGKRLFVGWGVMGIARFLVDGVVMFCITLLMLFG